ncbi:hypothetical protein E2562_019883 [Oryza meyeriana var. granulata]|uniref:Uncharacterized protein n=1 Tax=Oryza meyeriana var. granulata TaxID=110450 RepID=A0A6G1EXC5_9ORYZ|nr:hypothetical protein E2562_019883 [Oryza meyeriana var. granulata]
MAMPGGGAGAGDDTPGYCLRELGGLTTPCHWGGDASRPYTFCRGKLSCLTEELGGLPRVQWLEALVATERAKLDREHSALLEERGRLEATHKLLDTRVRVARVAHMQTLSRIEREQTALEEACHEAVMTQQEAEGRLKLTTQRE